MEKYKVTIDNNNAAKAINDKIAIDSLFPIGETITNSPLLLGDNYTSDDRVYNAALEYSKKHKGVLAQRLDTFVFIEGPYNVYKNEDGHTEIKRFKPINHTVAVNDTYIQVDGYRMKFKEKSDYIYMLRKTFIGTDNVTRFAGFITDSFWKRDALKIVNHVRQYGKYYKVEQ